MDLLYLAFAAGIVAVTACVLTWFDRLILSILLLGATASMPVVATEAVSLVLTSNSVGTLHVRARLGRAVLTDFLLEAKEWS